MCTIPQTLSRVGGCGYETVLVVDINFTKVLMGGDLVNHFVMDIKLNLSVDIY